jgi:hypothetical protein
MVFSLFVQDFDYTLFRELADKLVINATRTRLFGFGFSTPGTYVSLNLSYIFSFVCFATHPISCLPPTRNLPLRSSELRKSALRP